MWSWAVAILGASLEAAGRLGRRSNRWGPGKGPGGGDVSWLGLFLSLPFTTDFRLNLGNYSLLSTISFLHSRREKHPRALWGEETLSDSVQLLSVRAAAGGRA